METLQSLWWLAWLLALIGWLAFLLTHGCLQQAEVKAEAADNELAASQRTINSLNCENGQLCAQNIAHESRHGLLTCRLAELQPKGDELDKMHERAAIVKAAYEQHSRGGKCPAAYHQTMGPNGVMSYPVNLN